MKKGKRIIIATLLGLIFGIICVFFASSSGTELPYALKEQIIWSRILIGFAIGISSLKWHWALHGLILGFLFSFPLAFGSMMSPEGEPIWMFVATAVMGMIYGFLIELITTVMFKAKRE